MYKKVKSKTFEIIESGKTLPSRIFDISIIILILLTLITVVANTFDIPNYWKIIFSKFEIVSTIIFTVEYILRVWTSDLLYPKLSPAKARLKYIFSFMALIDFIAILPFYLLFFIRIDLQSLRTLRALRLLRIIKINRYTTALKTITQVFKNKANQLISSMVVVGLLMIISSVLMYNFEHEAQPDKFTNAFDSIWWAMSALTTVGYGDIYPITVAGKMLGIVTAIIGIGMVAVPTGIITAGFSEVLHNKKSKKTNNSKESIEDKKEEKKYCPYCGHRVDD
ncbi:MAG: ion transporter [Ruminococcus sp.]